jgi:hypothetical protein
VWFQIKGVKTEVAINLVLSEAEFVEFKQYCREKGFDLSYFALNFRAQRKKLNIINLVGLKL